MAAAALVVALLALPGLAQAAPLFRFADPRIDEASGIAPGRVSPGVVYVQNDSGGGNQFFAVDRRSGATDATITVAGATNVDWEDIAVGPDAGGRSSVWLADIGDNDAVRSNVAVYRVDEPRISTGHRTRTASGLRVWRLRYPDGPVDAEAFAVAPGGVGYVATKSLTGAAGVYRLPARPAAHRVQQLRREASIQLLPSGTTNPFGIVGQLTVTGASFSADGSIFAVRTYADAYLWRVRNGNLVSALAAAPTRVALPSQRQGEGIAVDQRRLLLDSEGAHSVVLTVPVPASVLGPSRSAGPSQSVSPSRSASCDVQGRCCGLS